MVQVDDRAKSQAVLLGTSAYTHLPPVAAAGHSLRRMHGLLTGNLCAWSMGQVKTISNQRKPGDLPDHLVELFTGAVDVALFYYVGHGQIDYRDELCLALTESRTEPERRATTSLTFDAVRNALLASDARIKIVILDCCYAGLAVGRDGALSAPPSIIDMTGGSGAYTLAASGAYNTAWFELDGPSPHTYFTKYLAEIVEGGIPGEPEWLSLDVIYRRLEQQLVSAGKPAPRRRIVGSADDFVFARNAVPQAEPSVPGARSVETATQPADSGPNVARRRALFDDIELAARGTKAPGDIADLLCRLAVASLVIDPARSRRLLTEVEHLSQDSDLDKAEVLLAVALAFAALDPDRSESIARSLDAPTRARALRGVAATLATTNPERSTRLLRDAELAAGEITDLGDQAAELARLALAVTPTAPEDGQRLRSNAAQIARAVKDPLKQAIALLLVSGAAAGTDPDASRALLLQAEQAADRIASWGDRAPVLQMIASEWVDTDPDRAEQVAHRIRHEAYKGVALVHVAAALTATSPDRAEQLVRSIQYPVLLSDGLSRIAVALAESDPQRSRRLLEDAERNANDTKASDYRDLGLASICGNLAVLDPERSERIARTINDPSRRDMALEAIAETVAPADPDRAEQIVRAITNPTRRASVLLHVAEALGRET